MAHRSQSLLSLRFTSPALEASFRADYVRRSIRLARVAVVLGVGMYALFGLMDPWMAPDGAGTIVWIRTAVCSYGLLLFGFTFFPASERYMQPALALFPVIGGLGVAAMSWASDMYTYYFAGLMLILFYVHVLLRLRFVWATAVSWLTIGVYEVVAIFLEQSSLPMLLHNNFFLVSTNISGMVASYALEHYARTVFLQTRYLEEKREEVEAQRQVLADKNQALEDTVRRLTAMQARLIHAEKMASLGQLTAGIAHEIKNPLNFVTNFAALTDELVEELRDRWAARGDDGLDEAAFQEVLDDIQENVRRVDHHGRRADAIVQSMLLHARSQPGQPQPVDVHDLLEEAIGLASQSWAVRYPGAAIRLEPAFDPAVTRVEGVPQELSRVFLNLLDNALYAVRERQQAAPAGYAPAIVVQTRQLTDHVEVRVTDNGPGLPPEQQQRVFEPFYTTKPPGSGTGLGLSISFDIVERGHRGSLDVESEAGRGATFVVRLPMQHSPVAAAAEAPQPSISVTS